MKKPSILLWLQLGALALLALFFTGCASRSIEAASTQFAISSPMGKTVTASLPKELDAVDVKLEVDPATGVIRFSAAQLKSSSQGVIDAATAAQANALGKLADTVRTLVPLVTPAAK